MNKLENKVVEHVIGLLNDVDHVEGLALLHSKLVEAGVDESVITNCVNTVSLVISEENKKINDSIVWLQELKNNKE